MTTTRPTRVSRSGLARRGRRDERGSAMVLAIFVLFLLAGMGVSLLFLSQTENRMSQADRRSKVAFFLAESGLEDARTTLFNTNRNEPFTDDLEVASGPNNAIDFDVGNLQATYDLDGNVTGFSGFGDDVALRPLTAAQGGWYAAFLTNDPIDGTTNTTDSNDRVLITAIGADSERSVEVVQAVVELRSVMPTVPPSTITLLGPQPGFESGTSNAKLYVGEDCDGSGIPGLSVPTVGAIGPAAEAEVEDGMNKPATFSSGPLTGADTVSDLTDPSDPAVAASGMGTIDSQWTDCDFLREMLDEARYSADLVCTGGTCTLPSPDPRQILYVEGDLTLAASDSNAGTLFVTGHLSMHGAADWNGLVFVVGEGRFTRFGAGNGHISGAVVLADIAGPDDAYGTGDDCTGGTDGFHEIFYDERGAGTGDNIYCSTDINNANPVRPYRVVDFLQH